MTDELPALRRKTSLMAGCPPHVVPALIADAGEQVSAVPQAATALQ